MDWLKKLLGDELATQVTEKLDGRELAIVKGEGADGSWVPQQKFSDLTEERNSLRTQLSERDTQLQTLQTAAGENESLKATIEEMRSANTAQAEEHAAALRKQARDFAVKQKLTEAQARNHKAVEALLDFEKVTVNDDGTVIGLDEQLAALKTEAEYLFGEVQSPEGGEGAGGTGALRSHQTGNGGSPGAAKNPWQKGENFSLTEQGRIYRENPDKARQLAAQAGVELP